MNRIVILVIFLALFARPVFAGQYGGVEQWYLYPSLQYFSWEEFYGGARLLKEEGPLFGIGGGALFDLYRKGLILKLNGEIFGGEVHYRGQTQSKQPLKTDVTYFGSKLESDLGWRISLPVGSVEPFAGIGYRWWLRFLEGQGGYTEWWQTVYTKLGLRGEIPAGSDLTLFAEAGGKYPFLNRNTVDFSDIGTITVKPTSRWSVFAEIGARYGSFRPAIFYEGFRYGESPKVPIVVGGVDRFLFQPESSSDIIGINLGWAFR